MQDLFRQALRKKKKLLAYFFIFIFVFSIVVAANYNNPLTRAIADSVYCKLTGCTMQGDLDMGNFSIINATWVNMTWLDVIEIIGLAAKLDNGSIARMNQSNEGSFNVSDTIYALEFVEDGVKLEDKYEAKSTSGSTSFIFDSNGNACIKIS